MGCYFAVIQCLTPQSRLLSNCRLLGNCWNHLLKSRCRWFHNQSPSAIAAYWIYHQGYSTDRPKCHWQVRSLLVNVILSLLIRHVTHAYNRIIRLIQSIFLAISTIAKLSLIVLHISTMRLFNAYVWVELQMESTTSQQRNIAPCYYHRCSSRKPVRNKDDYNFSILLNGLAWLGRNLTTKER